MSYTTTISDSYKNLLKDFILLEMLHDYKSERDNTTEKKQSARVINTKRYKKKYPQKKFINKVNLDKILNIGIPDEFTHLTFNENIERMFTNGEPETTMLSYITGMSKKKTIQSFMKDEVLKSPDEIGLWDFTCPISNNHFNVKAVPRSDEGSNFTNKLFDKNPVILTDTMVWVWKTFKSGNQPSSSDNVKKIYCYSPLPVRADSASKAESIDLKTIKDHKPYPWFQSATSTKGIQLVNVISNDTFTSKFFNSYDSNITNHGFFSKYEITTKINPYDKNLIQQEWKGLEFAGSDGSINETSAIITSNNRIVKINNAHYENSQPKTFIDINSRINEESNIGNFNKDLEDNDTVLNNLFKFNNLKNNIDREIVSLALQRKRSGDWLPVHYIRDWNDVTPPELRDLSLDSAEKDLKDELLEPSDKIFFKKNNMYILTNDRPLVSYCILCGINVLFIAATTPDPLLIKFEKTAPPPPTPTTQPLVKLNLAFKSPGVLEIKTSVITS